jgi:DNA-binding NtrC family response regulator
VRDSPLPQIAGVGQFSAPHRALEQLLLRPKLFVERSGELMAPQFAVLICDDDAEVREAMRRTLHRYAVHEAADPKEALAALKDHTFAAVVSDFSLNADNDGLELLQMVRLLYPNLVRFMVTGTRDLDVALRAVNEGSVDRFFLKPWDDFKLQSALELLLHTRYSALSQSR